MEKVLTDRRLLLNLIVLLTLALVPAYAFFMDQPFTITLMTRAVILGIAACGLHLALGYGGLVSLGHAAFFGMGGYTMGILASHAQSYEPLVIGGLSFEGSTFMPTIWLLAIVSTGLVAWLLGFLCRRTTGVYFIMLTLAFGQMFFYFAISWPQYGGEDGLSIYVRNDFPGLNTLDPLSFYVLCLGILMLVLIMLTIMIRSPFGLALNATRQNRERVLASGISYNRVLLIAYVISAMITALAGALYADLNRYVSPSMFSWQTSGEFIIIIILGGMRTALGPVVGAFVFVLLENWLGEWSDHWSLYLGLILLFVVLFAKQGIVGLVSPGGRSHG